MNDSAEEVQVPFQVDANNGSRLKPVSNSKEAASILFRNTLENFVIPNGVEGPRVFDAIDLPLLSPYAACCAHDTRCNGPKAAVEAGLTRLYQGQRIQCSAETSAEIGALSPKVRLT